MEPIQLYKTEKKIVIVGLYATGKTTLTKEILLLDPSFTLYKTDQYINRTSVLVSLIRHQRPEKYIVEGAAAYKMLRDGELKPDVVINCVCSDGERQRRYQQPDRIDGNRYKGDRPGMKTGYKAFDNYYRSLWQQYLDSKPTSRIIQYLTE